MAGGPIALRGRPLSPSKENARRYLTIARQVEDRLADDLPRIIAGIRSIALSEEAPEKVRLDAQKYLADRMLGAPARRKAAPVDVPPPIDPGDVHGQLQHLASLLTPSALEAIKSLVTNDLRQQGKLDDGEVEVGVS